MVNGRPKSRLPFEVPEIKEAIIKVALNSLHDPAFLKVLKAGYMELATFIDDDVAMRLDQLREAAEAGFNLKSPKVVAELGSEAASVQDAIIKESRTNATVFDEVLKKLKVNIN